MPLVRQPGQRLKKLTTGQYARRVPKQPSVKPPKHPGPREEGRPETKKIREKQVRKAAVHPSAEPPKHPGPREEGKEFLEQVGKAAGQIGFVGLAAILGAPYAVAIWIKVYVLGIGHVPGPSGDERV